MPGTGSSGTPRRSRHLVPAMVRSQSGSTMPHDALLDTGVIANPLAFTLTEFEDVDFGPRSQTITRLG